MKASLYEAAGIVLSLGCIFLIVGRIFDEMHVDALLIGWSISFLNHLADITIKRIGSKTAQEDTLKKLSAANLSRFVALLFLVFIILSVMDINHLVFVYSLLSSYIIFMTFDLIQFYQLQKNNQ